MSKDEFEVILNSPAEIIQAAMSLTPPNSPKSATENPSIDTLMNSVTAAMNTEWEAPASQTDNSLSQILLNFSCSWSALFKKHYDQNSPKNILRLWQKSNDKITKLASNSNRDRSNQSVAKFCLELKKLEQEPCATPQQIDTLQALITEHDQQTEKKRSNGVTSVRRGKKLSWATAALMLGVPAWKMADTQDYPLWGTVCLLGLAAQTTITQRLRLPHAQNEASQLDFTNRTLMQAIVTSLRTQQTFYEGVSLPPPPSISSLNASVPRGKTL